MTAKPLLTPAPKVEAEGDERAPNPVDIHVGSRVRLRRLLLGLSQEKLGDELGVTFQQVQKYERGANRIGASRLYRVARVLLVPIGFFFEGLEAAEMPAADPTPTIDAFINSPEGVALAAWARIESPAVRRKLLDLARTLAKLEGEP